ncbi:MAG: hypothetical protein H0X42_10965 [Solirubrobacterales bacterium]|nr:hypothetical protein [Solirubrobacterales bacterium]
MSRRHRIASVYARIVRTYLSRGPSLLLLAVIVFVPLGFFDALASELDPNSLDLGSGLRVAAVLAAVTAVTVTGLLGEVFYSGAVAISLTHPEGERPPTPLEIARRLNYARLILVDIAYVAIVIVGLVAVIVPGVLVFVWFGLSGPVVELEDRTVRGALGRSFALVRNNFWLVFAVLIPIEIVGDSAGDGIAALVHDALGHTFLASWLAESFSNIFLTPLFAIAAVLLTVDLIAEKDGAGSLVEPSPAPAPSAA